MLDMRQAKCYFIDFTDGPLGDFREVCSEDPEQGCRKVTKILLAESQKRIDTEYRLREVKRTLEEIDALKRKLRKDLNDL